MELIEALGKAIKARRNELDISQEQLGLSTETARPHLSNIEAGTASIGAEKFIVICKELKIKPSELWKMAEEVQERNSK